MHDSSALRLCTYDDLIAVMSESNIKILRHRGQLRQVRRASRGCPAMFDITSLPPRYRERIDATDQQLTQEQSKKVTSFSDSITMNAGAARYFAGYTLADGRHLPDYDQSVMTNNCSILDTCRQQLSEGDSHRARQSMPPLSRCQYFTSVSALLDGLMDAWPNSLPRNPRSLQRRYTSYLADGYQTMISAKWLNKNASKVLTDEQRSLLVSLIAHHNNLDNVFIADAYNRMAEARQWPTITPSTVANHRQRNTLTTAIGRRGLSNFRAETAMQVTRSRPTASFLLWTLDGWDCELLYQATRTDSRGHTVTTYHNRLCLEVVLDPSCDYPIGYAVGTHETPELISAALHNALIHTMELTGTMLRTNQLQCDHYAIKAMTPLYASIADKVTPAQVKNAKAKVVEPYFGYLNKTYCKRLNNWSGYGVTTDPTRQPNAEALNAFRHTFPDEQGVRRQIDDIILTERLQKRGQFLQLLQALPPERRLPMPRQTYLLHFGQTTGYRNAIEGPGLRPRILGERLEYDSFDITFREHADQRWQVIYDPTDLSTILAVNEDRSLQYLLERKHRQPMALADRQPGDAIQLQRVRDYNRQLETHVKEQMQIAHQNTERLLEDNPSDILSRLLIVNSDGQHKLPKAQQRLAIEQHAATDPEPVHIPASIPSSQSYTETNCPESADDPYAIFWE